MKIHFCDLCNESVPQSDLDEGRSFLRKGRVICAKCNALMSSPESSAASETSLGGVGASLAMDETLTGEEIGRVMRGEPPHAPDEDQNNSDNGSAPSVTAIPKAKAKKPPAADGGMEPEPT